MIDEIDYRNARYQGAVHLASSLRQGQGLLLDDLGNFFLSDWHKDRLNANTYIHLGRHNLRCFGVWRSGRLHGVNTFEHGSIRTIAVYRNGKVQGPILMVDRHNDEVYILESR